MHMSLCYINKLTLHGETHEITVVAYLIILRPGAWRDKVGYIELIYAVYIFNRMFSFCITL